jgi:hypothetical protein
MGGRIVDLDSGSNIDANSINVPIGQAHDPHGYGSDADTHSSASSTPTYDKGKEEE